MNKILLIVIGLILLSCGVSAWSVGDTITQTQIDTNATGITNNMLFVKIDANNYLDLALDGNYIQFTSKITTLAKDKGAYKVVDKNLFYGVHLNTINSCILQFGDFNCLHKVIPNIVTQNLNFKLLQERRVVAKYKTKIPVNNGSTLLSQLVAVFRGAFITGVGVSD